MTALGAAPTPSKVTLLTLVKLRLPLVAIFYYVAGIFSYKVGCGSTLEERIKNHSLKRQVSFLKFDFLRIVLEQLLPNR